MHTSGRVIGISFGISLSALLFSVSLLPNESNGHPTPLAKVEPLEVVSRTNTAIITPTIEIPATPARPLPETETPPPPPLASNAVAHAPARASFCDPGCQCGKTGVCTCGTDCRCSCRKSTEVGKPTTNFSSSTLPAGTARAVTCQAVGLPVDSRVSAIQQLQRTPQTRPAYRVVQGRRGLLWWIVPNASSTMPASTVVTHAEPFSMKTQSVLAPSQRTQVVGQPEQVWMNSAGGFSLPPGFRQTTCSGGSCRAR